MNSRERAKGSEAGLLPDGASVGVIGAGPAGTFFALHLRAALSSRGRKARIVLIDRKAFHRSGPAGCNMCAGAIGEGMVRKMESVGLPLDERVVRRIADGYEIHGGALSVVVRSAERGAIYTVFRGGGPVAPCGTSRGFDQHLLDAAVARGAEFVHDRVEAIARVGAGGYRVTLAGGGAETFDFLVGAFGVNTAISGKLAAGYDPPRTWHTVQAELPAGNEFIESRLRNRIHIVPAASKGIRFVAITPKDDFLTVTAIGKHVRIGDLERERASNRALAALLPREGRVLCHCHPQIPVGFSRKPYGDRLAVAGDAFISRYLKNGIESSYDTTAVLASAVAEHGVSERALRDHFFRPCIARFRYDNVWGRALFGIYESVLRRGRLSDAYLRSVERGVARGRGTQARILWSVFAGDAPYRDIARVAFGPRALWGLSRDLVAGAFAHGAGR